MVADTQSDSIQRLNLFNQYSIQYCFTQDSIQHIIQFKKKSADSIEKIIQFNSHGIINTGQIGKVPKIAQKVSKIEKRGLFIKNGKYCFKIWFIHSFQEYSIQKNYSIIFFLENSIQKF